MADYLETQGACAGSWAFSAQLSRLCSARCRQLSSPNFPSLSSLVETLKYVGAVLQEAGVNVELSVAQHLETVSACILCSSTVAYSRSVSLCPLHVSQPETRAHSLLLQPVAFLLHFPETPPTPGPTKPFFPMDTIQMLCHQSHFPEPQHILTGFLWAVCLPSSGP